MTNPTISSPGTGVQQRASLTQTSLTPFTFETGTFQSHALSVSGGSDVVSYFVSGRYAKEDGAYGAGVGIKRHDPIGHELAVVTTARLQGRGLARRLVAQAGRRILDEDGLPTYLHDRRNEASARVADAVGFPDRLAVTALLDPGLAERRQAAARIDRGDWWWAESRREGSAYLVLTRKPSHSRGATLRTRAVARRRTPAIMMSDDGRLTGGG